MTARDAGRPAATSEAVTADRGALMRASRAERDTFSAWRLVLVVIDRGDEVVPEEKAVAARGRKIREENFIFAKMMDCFLHYRWSKGQAMIRALAPNMTASNSGNES